MEVHISSDYKNYAVFELSSEESEILYYILEINKNIKNNFTVKESQTNFSVKSNDVNVTKVSFFISYINRIFNTTDIRIQLRQHKIKKITNGSTLYK